MAEDIMKANQSSEDTFRDIAVNTQVMSEKLSNFLDSQKARVVGTGVDMYELTVAEMEGGLDQLRDGMQSTTDAWIQKGAGFVDEMFANNNSEGILSGTMSEIGELGKQIKNDTITTFGKLTESMDIFQDKLDDTPVQGDGDGGTPVTLGQKCIDKGGIMVGGKCMKGADDITATLAKGGIVMKPTKALIGEGSEPEAVLPLSRLDNMIGNTNKT